LLIIGAFSIYVSRPASVISVSSINIDAQGASIGDYVSNDYRKLSGGYWVISLTINSYQSVYAIKFGPQNVTGVTLNGQKVITNQVVEFDITPQVPYLTMALTKTPAGGAAFTPSASGFQIVTATIVAGDPDSGQNDITASPSFVNYLAPRALSSATVHVPFEIDAYVAGGLSGWAIGDKQTNGTSSWTINPVGNADAYQITTNYGTAVVNFLGYLSGPITLPYGLDRLTFLPYDTTKSITDSAGSRYFVVLDAGDKIASGYQSYFYRGLTSSTSAYNNLAGVPIDATNTPGWAYSEFRTISGLTWYSMWPLKANVTGTNPGGYYYTLNPGWFGDYIKQVTNSRMGLLDWLYTQNPNSVIGSMTPDPFQSWKVTNPDGNNPQLHAEIPQNMFTPVITIRIPFDMADTLVYSPKITTFKIDSITLNPTTIRAGQTSTLTVKVTNTGNVKGTATVKVIPDSNHNVFPLLNTITLDPGGSGSLDFAVSVGSITSDVTSFGSVEVYNMDGVLCDSKSYSILLKPQLGRIYISAITLNPLKLLPGGTATLVVKVANQGGSSVSGKVKIVTDSFLSAPTKEKTASIGPGLECSFSFTVTAGTSAGISNLKIELYDQDGKLLEGQTLYVTISGDNPPPPPPPPVMDKTVWILLGLAGVLAIAIGLYIKSPATGILLMAGLGLIVTAIVGYFLSDFLVSQVTVFGYALPVWQLLIGLALLVLLAFLLAGKKFKLKLPKLRVNWK
jgi:hypothetical protein